MAIPFTYTPSPGTTPQANSTGTPNGGTNSGAIPFNYVPGAKITPSIPQVAPGLPSQSQMTTAGINISPANAQKARGELGSIAPLAGSIAGGVAGAALGGLAASPTILGIPAAAYAGGVTGAGLGAAAGQVAKNKLQGTPATLGATAKTGGEYAAAEALGIPGAKLAEPFVKAGVDAVAPVIGKGIGKVGDMLGSAGSAIGKGVDASIAAGKQALLGKEGLKTLAQVANPEAQQFVPIAQGGAGKTFQSVVDGTQNAIDSFVSKSKAALQSVKSKIPDIPIAVTKITSAVNKGILNSVQGNATYHGIQGDAASLFKNPDDLINSGLLNQEEAGRVKGMVNVIKNWTDNSARGVLNLKEALAPFYKDGLGGSNNILRGIQNGLKDLVGEVHPEIKGALNTASRNIDKASEFTRNLVGTNETTGEAKLATLARSLSNPAAKGYQHSLLEDLKNATGHDVEPQLKGYADYLGLLAKDFPTKAGTIIQTGAKRLGIGAAGVAGATEIGNILGL